MFELGKILWTVFAPANLLVIGLCLAWFFMGRRDRRAWGWPRLLLGSMTIVCLLIAVTPLSHLPMQLLENRFSRPAIMPAKVDGIIVLGGGMMPLLSISRDEPVMLASGNVRLAAFVDLARRYPDARLIFAGGSGSLFSPAPSEASIARVALERMGLEIERARFEDRSRNTEENALFSKEMMKPKKGETWFLITSASHMPRAIGVFRAQDWDVTPYPVGYITSGDPLDGFGFDFLGGLAALQTGVREWIGMIGYYAYGYTNEIFPAP
ncbi:MAG: YdcF family protein [Reyranellaceae bacterium]